MQQRTTGIAGSITYFNPTGLKRNVRSTELFPVSFKPTGAPPDGAPKDQGAAEVDITETAEELCRCCAEALPFVEGIWTLVAESELLAIYSSLRSRTRKNP